MTTARRGLRAGLVLVVLLATPALAQEAAVTPVPETSSDFWREIRSPGHRRARTLLRHGLERLSEARQAYGIQRRAALVEGGITRLRLAHHHAPTDPEVLFYLATALAQFDRPMADGTVRRRDDEAIASFELLRTLDPSWEANRVAFELGVLFTRIGQHERAIAEYERAIATAFADDETITAHANAAEVRMLSGDLETAVTYYERAITLARDAGALAQTSLLLALFGDAVALDRLGETTSALGRAREAVGLGGGRLDVLRADGVFFEPAYEVHHYEGLGHLALAESAPTRDERIGSLRDARRSFQRFLGEGGADGAFADAARERYESTDRRLRALEAERGTGRPPGRRGR